jgi:hypothetical protein
MLQDLTQKYDQLELECILKHFITNTYINNDIVADKHFIIFL